MSGRDHPSLVESGQNLTQRGPKAVQVVAALGRRRPSLGRARPSSNEVGQESTKVGPTSAESGPDAPTNGRNFDRNRPELGRVRPNVRRSGPSSVRFSPDLGHARRRKGDQPLNADLATLIGLRGNLSQRSARPGCGRNVMRDERVPPVRNGALACFTCASRKRCFSSSMACKRLSCMMLHHAPRHMPRQDRKARRASWRTEGGRSAHTSTSTTPPLVI